MKKCIECHEELPSNRLKYCSEKCKRIHLKQVYIENNPFMGKSPATTGAISELRVSVDLLAKGYDVFRALSPSCTCDLAIIKDGKLFRIEVRTTHMRLDGTPTRNHGDKTKADIWAWVSSEGVIYEPNLP